MLFCHIDVKSFWQVWHRYSEKYDNFGFVSFVAVKSTALCLSQTAQARTVLNYNPNNRFWAETYFLRVQSKHITFETYLPMSSVPEPLKSRSVLKLTPTEVESVDCLPQSSAGRTIC